MSTNGYYINDFGVTIDFGKILKIILRNAWIMILSGITMGLLFLVISKTCITPTYVVTSKVYILNHMIKQQITTYDVSASTSFTKDYSELICSRNNLEAVISRYGFDMTCEELQKKITVQYDQTNSRILRVIVEDTDPYRCFLLTKGICEELQNYINSNIPSCSVQIVENAVYPKAKSAPRSKVFAVLGALLGGMLAFFIICLKQLTNNRIITEKDVEKYLNITVLGSIPLNTKKMRMR